MVKEFNYKGKTNEELRSISNDELFTILNSRQRRSLKRGLSDNKKKLIAEIKMAAQGKNKNQIKTHKLQGKFGCATGTWSAHKVAYPKVNWIRFATRFIKSLGLEPNLVTTQIEPHDSLAESYHQIVRVNSICTDLCRDMWSYISRGVLGQQKMAGEIGSSTMPLNINPIQFYLECNLDDKLIQHWINIRVTLEPTLARIAASNRTDEDLANLKDIVNKLELEENKKNGELLAALDKNFHSTIAEATKNPIVSIIMRPIYEMMPKIKTMVLINKSPGLFKFGNEEHEKIYKCIANKDGDGAFLSMVEHMDSATRHVSELSLIHI